MAEYAIQSYQAGARVIDYKSTARPLDPAMLRRGLQLQLPAYLLALAYFVYRLRRSIKKSSSVGFIK